MQFYQAAGCPENLRKRNGVDAHRSLGFGNRRSGISCRVERITTHVVEFGLAVQARFGWLA